MLLNCMLVLPYSLKEMNRKVWKRFARTMSFLPSISKFAWQRGHWILRIPESTSVWGGGGGKVTGAGTSALPKSPRRLGNPTSSSYLVPRDQTKTSSGSGGVWTGATSSLQRGWAPSARTVPLYQHQWLQQPLLRLRISVSTAVSQSWVWHRTPRVTACSLRATPEQWEASQKHCKCAKWKWKYSQGVEEGGRSVLVGESQFSLAWILNGSFNSLGWSYQRTCWREWCQTRILKVE